MAQFNSKASKFFNLVLILSLLFMVSMAESRQLGIGFGKAKATPVCNSVYGAEDGDTCISVAQKFKLSDDFFLKINPNINCDTIFVGQWLCTDGSAN
ncbi:unnamed protein product [Ilex paraguariensis]|uniref:LysM domain-containing protein n=1 Tax=Ilex paraguariensis TaxID=185542 RepID=A0ABC8RXV0_9AQUA